MDLVCHLALIEFRSSQSFDDQQRIIMAAIISIVGKSGSGKTTLIEKLIPELRRRGHRIGTIKHAAHGIQVDREGKDSWRHRQAGADTVVVATADTIAMVKNTSGVELNSLERYFDDVDLIITEGFKREDRPKIEVFRSGAHDTPLCGDDPQLFAFVTDSDFKPEVPILGLEDIEKLADLIEQKFIPSRFPQKTGTNPHP
jgi:molybdopterin-guanine dinucleotide biosynthesis protein B